MIGVVEWLYVVDGQYDCVVVGDEFDLWNIVFVVQGFDEGGYCVDFVVDFWDYGQVL